MTNDERYMWRCLQLAQLGRTRVAPNPMVGAVIVHEDRILGEGWHRQYGSWHAEVNAVNSVREEDRPLLKEATIYVSLEPCAHYGKTPPCAKLLAETGFKRVVCGMLDPNPLVAGKGLQIVKDAGCSVTVGVLEQECRKLNKRFLCLQEKKRPYITLKWAQSSDGYLDWERTTAHPGCAVISNRLTKQEVHKMRAENMAILVGTNTVLQDNPRLLTTRWTGRNPLRLTVDRKGRIPADAKICSNDAETVIYKELEDILPDLAKRNIHSLLVEGGTQTHRWFFEHDLWDELQVEVSPARFGQGVKAPEWPCVPHQTETVEDNILYHFLHP